MSQRRIVASFRVTGNATPGLAGRDEAVLKKGKLGVGIGAAAVALTAVAFVLLSQRTAPANRLDPGDRQLVQRGAEVYVAQCASCHGAELEGQANWRQRQANGRLPAPPHDESGHTHHHHDELLMKLTKHGPAALAGNSYESDMPAYAGVLSDADIRAVLSYIKSTWPPEVQRRHDALNEQARSR
jgi:mono/diheme cytochrome c family protein